MLVIGITGNYGMGKSYALNCFKKLGAAAFDADEFVGQLLREKPVLEKLRALFGREAFFKNGRLNRKKTAQMIFNDSNKRLQMEDILHPLVFQRLRDALSHVKEDIVVFEAALIFERGYEGEFAKTVTVYADRETTLKRLSKKNISEKTADLVLKTQMPIKKKISLSDYCVDNSGARAETRLQIESIYKVLKSGLA